MKLIMASFVSLFAYCGPAHAALITDPSDPALDNAVVIDFDDQDMGAEVDQLTIGLVTFDAYDPQKLQIANAQVGGSLNGTSGLVLRTQNQLEGFTVSFAIPVSAFGMIWGDGNADWTVKVYDLYNVLIATEMILGTDETPPIKDLTQYWGIQYAAISYVEFIAGGADEVKIDDFAYAPSGGAVVAGAVPAPAAAPLLGAALAAFAAVSRRRRRS